MSSVVEKPTGSRSLTIRDHLEGDAFKQRISQILPKHLTPDRMARVAITALSRTPLLSECDQASFFQAMLNLSAWGLEPDGRRAHLIPFRNNKKGIMEVQLIIDYKGLVELAMRSGVVSRIHADIVCENDRFKYDRGELMCHEINFREPRGDVYAVYCLIKMKDGSEKCEVMTIAEVEAIRKRSKSWNNGPWVTDWNEMAKKTVFRRSSKWIPLSAEIRDAAESDDDTIEATSVSVSQRPRNLNDLTERLISSLPEPMPEGDETVDPNRVEDSSDPCKGYDLASTFSTCTTLKEVQDILAQLIDAGVDDKLAGDAAEARRLQIKEGRKSQKTLIDTTPSASAN